MVYALSADPRCLYDVLRRRGAAEVALARWCSFLATSMRPLLKNMTTEARIVDIPTARAIVWIAGAVK